MGRLALAAVLSSGLIVSGGLTAVGCGGDGGEGVLPGVQALVFVKRAFITGDGGHNVAGGAGQVIDYNRYVPGGGVFVLEPPTPDGTLRELTEEFEGVDVNGLDLSFDARQVVFSMRHSADNRYHIYIGNLDGSGIRQLTFGDSHDVMPIFIPGGRVAFVTNEPYTAMGTRADEYNHSRVVTQMATISIESGDADRRLCAQNLSHVSQPFLLSDGTIGFAQWEHFATRNEVSLRRMNPDCTGILAVAGEFNKRFNSIVQAQEIEPGVYIGIGTSRSRTIQAGALMHVDARSRTATDPSLFIDVQDATFENLTPAVPTGMASPPSGVGRYRDPRPLPGHDDFIVSWADGDVNDRNELAQTAPNFGIYLWDRETGNRTLVYDDPQFWDVYAIPVAPRDTPPVITPIVPANPDVTEPSILGSIDITSTSLPERVRGAQFDGVDLAVALGEAERVRVIEGFSSEIGAVGMFGLTLHEGGAILGETPVYEDGSWRAAVPAYLPYHLQPIDRYGLAIRDQRLWIQAMPGETRTCGGCHADRSHTVQPRMGTQTIAQQLGAQDLMIPIPDRHELPWYGAASGMNIQDIFDANCVSCHDGGTNDPYAGRFYTVNVTTMGGEELEYEIPYLLLTSDPIEVFYDNEVVNYPASYVTLLYPSAMMGDSMATGDVPPEWVRPGFARTSRLMEVLNMWAADDPSDIAWRDRPLHPEDQGVDLDREHRLDLIRMTDLGGQYYSRRNVEGGYDWSAVREY